MAQQSTGNNASVVWGGANNAADTTTAARRDLYLKLFSGEMFKGFQRNTIARDLITKRTLKNGRSLQFIFTGRTASEFHVPGRSILGNDEKAPSVAEVTIECDDLLISSAFVYELDEVLSHYDLRGEISRKIGYALAENYDRRIFRAVSNAARLPHPVTGASNNAEEPGGTQIRVGSAGTPATSEAWDAASIVNAFYDAAAALDEKGVGGDGRVAVISPRQYYELIQNQSTNALINRDEQGDSLQTGNGIISIAGIKIYKSMNIPFLGKYGVKYGETNGPADPGNKGDFVEEATVAMDAATTPTGQKTVNEYGAAAEFNNSCGLIFQKEAVGCVEAIGPQVQVTSGDVSVVYQGDVILGRLAMGAKPLNPACAVELFAGTNTKPAKFVGT
jgi:hypothetical protein